MTCGTADKRAFLLEAFPKLREDHIGDSRSCSFEETVKRQTAGKGVHLALNSLADDKLQVHIPYTCFVTVAVDQSLAQLAGAKQPVSARSLTVTGSITILA